MGWKNKTALKDSVWKLDSKYILTTANHGDS